LKLIPDAAALSLKMPPYGAPTALRTSFLSFGHRAAETLRTPIPNFPYRKGNVAECIAATNRGATLKANEIKLPVRLG
jgi:hypothetical protein